MKAIETVEDGAFVSVGNNFNTGVVHEPLAESIVFLEVSTDRETAVAGLTRDEAVDLTDGILAVLESYGVAPSA